MNSFEHLHSFLNVSNLLKNSDFDGNSEGALNTSIKQYVRK